eukprot:9277338-Ditylum_brightwellii.AAC.2
MTMTMRKQRKENVNLWLNIAVLYKCILQQLYLFILNLYNCIVWMLIMWLCVSKKERERNMIGEDMKKILPLVRNHLCHPWHFMVILNLVDCKQWKRMKKIK